MQQYKITWLRKPDDNDIERWEYSVSDRIDSFESIHQNDIEVEVIAAESIFAADEYAADICDDLNYWMYEQQLS